MRGMRKVFFTAVAACLAAASAPAGAAADNFTLVNGTGQAMSELAIRRFGTQAWAPLGVAAPAGGRVPVSFSNPDCAFDIRAKLAGGTIAIWSGVNLCEVKAVRLNREPSGELWADYE